MEVAVAFSPRERSGYPTGLAEAVPLSAAEPDEGVATLLFTAAQDGLLDVVQYAVESGAAVTWRNAEGKTALQVAAQHGHWAVVGYLASRGPEGQELAALLLLAAEHGHPDTVRYLLEAGAAPDMRDGNDTTALGIAARHGHGEVVALLLAAGASVRATNRDGETALYAAAERGHARAVWLLLAARSPVGQAAANGRPPLYAAAWNGHAVAAELLLAAKAEVDQADRERRTPLYVAALHGHPAVVTLLIRASATLEAPNANGYTPLYIASIRGQVEVARLLLAPRAEVDRPNSLNGRSPLWVACLKGQLEAAKVLVEAGADLNHRDRDGLTPLIVVAREGFPALLQWLLAAAADPLRADGEGRSPLWVAVQYQHTECVGALLEVGMDVNARHPQTGETVLMCAAATGNADTVRLLQARGARADLRDSQGFTTYYHADCDPEVETLFAPPRLSELLEACGDGAATPRLAALLEDPFVDPNAGDKCLHWTPLMEAVRFGTPEAVALLVSHGADPTVPMFCGLTAAFWATLRGDPAIVAALGACDVPRGARDEVLGARELALTPREAAGLAAVREMRWRSEEAAELLAFHAEGGAARGPGRGRRGPQGNTGNNVQARMADVQFDTAAGHFYPADYHCPVSLLRFLTTDPAVHRECEHFDVQTDRSPVLQSMVAEGRKMLAVLVARLALCAAGHVLTQSTVSGTAGARCSGCGAALADGDVLWGCSACPQNPVAGGTTQGGGADNHVRNPDPSQLCPRCWAAGFVPEDVFALFCYTFESVAYQRSNWAMRNWRLAEAQPALELWRPFIYHCEQALRRLPRQSVTVYRGIPIPFDGSLHGPGQEFLWPSFSSTSALLKVATNFARRKNGVKRSLIFMVEGQSGSCIRHCSHFPAEAEVLFPPNLHLRTKWLGKGSVLGDVQALLTLPLPAHVPARFYALQPHELTPEAAAAEDVVFVYCEEVLPP
eukprot:EG_transcript_1021